uniref:Reverse transcriptase domain-containing protein n=1 Tax=Astyanax mexicanus TaxID=7994 RepID=A0A3B1JJ67_ASTMX
MKPKKRQPEGPPRGGMEEGPILTDHMVTNGMDSHNEKFLRKCTCGWQKVTSLRGLHIHQGKMKCGRIANQHDRAAAAGQTAGTGSQVSNHSAAGPSSAEQATSAEVLESREATPESTFQAAPPPLGVAQPASQRKQLGRRNKIKWPKSKSQEEWRSLDDHLSVVLEHSLRGTVEHKLASLSNIIYEECRERFGECAEKRAPAPRQKGRRERGIEELIANRRELRKRWRKAAPEEWEGLKLLWSDLKQRLGKLRRAERIRKRRQRKEKERRDFYRDPFKYACQLLEEKRSGKLSISKEDLEQYIKGQYTDESRDIPLGSPGYVPRPDPPKTAFDIAPPRLSEIKEALRKARSGSAPGPNGIPYKLYKHCPQVTKIVWNLMRVVWKNKSVPAEWQEAVGIFIPKEQNSTTTSQFRSIALLNVEGKIFFTVLARRIAQFLKSNSYIDTSCQKAGLPGFPGCIEHATMIWEQIQRAKREKSDLHVVWLDMANAYGSVPHKLVEFALEFFYIPDCIITIIGKYFSNLRMSFVMDGFATGWQQLEVGIAMGCSISPILFVAAFEVILIGARQVARGLKTPEGGRFPALRGYMDDVTSILQTAPCTARLLKRLEELTMWARMKIKSSKSRSLSIRKGVRDDRTVFSAGGEKIPLLAEQPIRSLGREYTAELSDRQMGTMIQRQLREGLIKINSSQLPGKLKVWCYQFTLFQRVMWPLKVCEVPSSVSSKMDGIANSYMRKWLGLPRCFSDAGLFGKNMLQLPLKSINLGYKQEKTRLVLEVNESRDEVVKGARVAIRTGRKWRAQEEVNQAISRLQHKEVLGRTQVSQAGLGWGESVPFWSKATREQRKIMVVEEVSQVEQDRYLIKAVSQGKQGAWTRWEDTINRVITWTDIWRMPQSRLSFLLRAAYDTLPCPQNLSQWFGSEEKCPLCSKLNVSLQHILSGCSVALSQGRLRWRHNQVLRKLAEQLEESRVRANIFPEVSRPKIPFVKPGEGVQKTAAGRPTCLLSPGKEWEMRVDLGTKLIFPSEITQTTLRPDVVMWSRAAKKVLIIELTVPWEEGMLAAYEYKRLKYSDLAAECREGGWTTSIHPVEVGCRGFVGKSTMQLLRDTGMTGTRLKKAVKELAEEAEKASYWLWLRRKDSNWGSTPQ